MEKPFFILTLGAVLVPLASQLAPGADATALQATIERLRGVSVPSAQRIIMDRVYDSAHPELHFLKSGGRPLEPQK